MLRFLFFLDYYFAVAPAPASSEQTLSPLLILQSLFLSFAASQTGMMGEEREKERREEKIFDD